MTDHLSFILAPSTSTNLKLSQTLNFLPFSLGPSSNPYASTSAPISTYFQPRPCPPNHTSLKEGTPIAAFRGRQLVGQNAEVPTGYKGIILRAGARPDRGGATERGKPKEGKWPLTPATSVASTSSAATATSEDGVRRSPRKARGAGQVALSKPRQTFRKGLRKRLRLDSDSEEEDPPAEPNTTPPKRQKGKAQITPVKPPPLELPEIKVQSPTPRKGLPDEEGWGTMRLRGPTGMEEADPYGGIEAEQVEYVRTEVVDESVVPSPATEDLPPLFKVESKTNIVEDAKAITPSDGVAGIEESGKMAEGQLMREEADETSSNDTDFVRQLRPISTFDSITLWTADVPLAGFRQDELLNRTDINVEDSGPASSELMAPQDEGAGSLMPKVEENGEVKVGAPVDTPDAGSDGKSTDVNPGWWRVGGAGEGGDEFVRGMGEWLGLVHMINDPIYLRDLPKEEDEDEDDA